MSRPSVRVDSRTSTRSRGAAESTHAPEPTAVVTRRIVTVGSRPFIGGSLGKQS